MKLLIIKFLFYQNKIYKNNYKLFKLILIIKPHFYTIIIQLNLLFINYKQAYFLTFQNQNQPFAIHLIVYIIKYNLNIHFSLKHLIWEDLVTSFQILKYVDM